MEHSVHAKESGISIGEFDEFLKGAAYNQTKDKQQ